MINIIPSLNNLTNILTVVLYISYSIIKRIDASQFIIVALTAAWIINISLLIYSILKILSDQEVIEKSRKNWIYFRTIVNLVFLLLTIYLF
jgi:hypothetical protein